MVEEVLQDKCLELALPQQEFQEQFLHQMQEIKKKLC
jgi:hypothetical protein